MRNKIFEKIPITLPSRSGFDLSHENSGTGKPGLLIPVFTRECEGRDSLSVNLAQQVQFPPFATDFYGRIKVYFEAFFVPYRIIYGGYKTQYTYGMKSEVDPSNPSTNPYLPGLDVYYNGVSAGSADISGLTLAQTADPSVGFYGRGSLLDYLGVKVNKPGNDAAANVLRLNNMNRLLAYHMIYDKYYCDTRIQREAFHLYQYGNTPYLRCLPSTSVPLNGGQQYFYTNADLLGDGANICGFRARSYAKDYFTMATPSPQFGNEINVQADANGLISISQIRAGSALQQFTELYNRVGLHYDDLAFAQTGIRPSDAAVDIPVYLGRLVYDVYNRSVLQTNGAVGSTTSGSTTGRPTIISSLRNPYGSIASKTANAQSVGSGHLCDFTATEGGIFMVLMSVAPDATYSSGSARQWKYRSVLEFPKPQLAGIGDQPIYGGELVSGFYSAQSGNYELFDESAIFGYSQRFAEAKFMLDEVHGELQEYGSLQAFQLKRHFDGVISPTISTDFLRIPIDSLSEVSIFSSVSPLTTLYWFDLYFETKLVSNLPAYSLPTLENMQGETAMVDNGGRRF